MDAFFTGIGSGITAVTTGLLGALKSAGELFFTVSEAGAVTGLTPFSYLTIIMVSLSLGTWLLSLVFNTFVKGIAKGGGRGRK